MLGYGRKKQGFTLMEALVVIAILAVIAAVTIPSFVGIRNFLLFRERNDYARAIFLAAQSQLTKMRSNGELDLLQGNPKEALGQMGDEGDVPPEGYAYTHGGDRDYFDLVLPMGSVDETLRDDKILIEYSAVTGNVYSVFYYEGDLNIAELYGLGQLPRNEADRRNMQLGYYDGSDLDNAHLGVYHVSAEIDFENGQEGIVTVLVPTQAGNISFVGDDFDGFMNGLSVELTVSGEMGGTFTKSIKTVGNTDNCEYKPGIGGANFIYITYPLDSLTDGGSFANKACKTLGENETLTDIPSESSFEILPGDNVSITAEVTFTPGAGDPIVIIESAAIAGVNPMCASLTESSTEGMYILAVSNGRNLQNLNALAPSIAEKVEAVVFTGEGDQTTSKTDAPDIDWQDTVNYYNSFGIDGSYENSADEAPARSLPYFVPIHNEYLFGTAEFTGAVPSLQETNHRTDNADVVGNGAKIYNLHIDTGKYETAKDFYAGSADAANHRFAGLFGYVNTNVDKLFVVNPVIRGAEADGYSSAAGALIGAAGQDTHISNCGAYIDVGNATADALNMREFAGENGQYGVSGYGAVGGLVGYGESVNVNGYALMGCFGAVPVYGEMRHGANSGFTDGVGGLVGNAQMVHFLNCYASGYVRATGCGTDGDHGAAGNGAGGFAGTSHGSRFTNCFATGNVRGDAASGGFVGVMCYDTRLGAVGTAFSSCYAVGLTYVGGGIYEVFSGANTFIDTDFAQSGVYGGDFYRNLSPYYLKNDGGSPEQYIFKDCYYLSGYVDEAAEDNGASWFCAAPESYDAFAALHTDRAGSLLERLKNTPFDSAEALNAAKAWLREIPVKGDTDAAKAKNAANIAAVLDGYTGTGSYKIYFDAARYLSTGSGMEKRYTAQYRLGFHSDVWGEAAETHSYDGGDGAYPFSMLSGLPYYGSWPKAPTDKLSYGVLYYERYDDGAGVHLVNLSDWEAGTPTGLDSEKQVQEAGYALYCKRGTTPFSASTNAMMGEELEGLHSAAGLSDRYGIYALATNGECTVSSRAGARSATVNPYFADTINQTSGAYQIRCQAQLENIALFPTTDFVLEGIIELDSSYEAIPSFSGTLTGTSGSKMIVTDGSNGLIDTLDGGTLRGISVVGSFQFTGAKGVLANTMQNGALVTRCEVDARITAQEAAAVGTVVGRMEGSTIETTTVGGSLTVSDSASGAVGGVVGHVAGASLLSKTESAASVTGEADNAGLFVGYAQAGTFRDCHATDTDSKLPFAGAAETDLTETVENATHYSQTKLENGLLAETEVAEKLTALNGTVAAKPRYRAAFESCTFMLGGAAADVMGTTYFYQLTPVGGYRAMLCDSPDQFELADVTYADLHEGVTEDWQPTQYFVCIEDNFHRLRVKVTEEFTFQFGYAQNGEEITAESNPVTVADMDTAVESVTFDGTACAIYGVRSAPTSGTYLLVTADGNILHIRDSMIVQDAKPADAELTEDLFWIPDGEGWTDVTVTRQGSNTYLDGSVAVTVSYEETLTVTVTETGADGTEITVTTTETQPREVECFLYEVTANTDSEVVLLDSCTTLRAVPGSAGE